MKKVVALSALLIAGMFTAAVGARMSWRTANRVDAASSAGTDAMTPTADHVAAIRSPERHAMSYPARRSASADDGENDASTRRSASMAEGEGGNRVWFLRLDGRFASEAVDTSWSGTMTDRMRQDLDRKLPEGARLVSIECRSTMCRAEAAHPDKQSYDSFARAVIASNNDASIGGIAVMRFEDQANREVHAIAFIARGEEDLPTAEELSAAQ